MKNKYRVSDHIENCERIVKKLRNIIDEYGVTSFYNDFWKYFMASTRFPNF